MFRQKETIEPQGVVVEGEDIHLVFDGIHFEVLLCKEEVDLLEDYSESEAGSADVESDSSDSGDDAAPEPSPKKQKTCKGIFKLTKIKSRLFPLSFLLKS